MSEIRNVLKCLDLTALGCQQYSKQSISKPPAPPLPHILLLLPPTLSSSSSPQLLPPPLRLPPPLLILVFVIFLTPPPTTTTPSHPLLPLFTRWYFGTMNRFQAQSHLLAAGHQQGAFLVRQSEKDGVGLVLSGKEHMDSRWH